MKKKINKTLKKMKLNIEIWYDRSAAQWVITGTNNNDQYISKGTGIYKLDMYNFEEWISMILWEANKQ
tara:strand:+ start:72 stop:275 length:204 start_codon:yes stop_codon:yes gene_type:complete